MPTLQDQEKTINDLIDQAQKAVADGDIETANKLKEEITAAREAYDNQKAVADEVNSFEKVGGSTEKTQTEQKTETQKENEKPEVSKEDVKVQEETTKVQDTPVDDPEEFEKKKLGGKRMARKVLDNKNSEEVNGFLEYVRSKGAKRDNVKSVDAQPLIPEDIKYQPEELPETFVDLKKFVNVTPVTTAAGSYPVLNPAQETMVSVAELEKNPELAKPKFTDVDYKVQTYRGQIPVSQESLDDSEADLSGIIARNNARQAVNTTNKMIADVMKTFPAKSISDLDGIKGLINVDIDPAYNLSIVASQSMYQALDTLKDKNGQYLLKQDITSASGTTLFGRPVYVIKDELLGAKGEAKAFIGDLKYAILFADRKQATVKWVENEIYGQILAAYMRFDVKKAVEQAGVFVTYSATTTPTA